MSEGQPERAGAFCFSCSVQRKAWTLLEKAEEDGDNRGADGGVARIPECVKSLRTMSAKAGASKAGAADSGPPCTSSRSSCAGGAPGVPDFSERSKNSEAAE